MPKTFIRRAAAGDFTTLLEIDRASFPPGVAYESDELSYFMSRSGAETIVLERDGEIAAFLIFEMDPRRKTAILITVDVRKEFQRCGYGTQLMKQSEEMLATQGIHTYQLQVDVENAAAIAFYLKHGFQHIRLLKNYYANGHDAHLMVKTLRVNGGM